MFVSDILSSSDGTRFSLEVYPPKVVAGSPDDPSIQQHLSAIFDTVEHLLQYDPAFVSVTYNPEGKTRATSIPIAAIIKQRFKVESVAHLTCIATPRSEIAQTLDVLRYFNIENVLALRGDRPETADASCDGLDFASDLVKEITAHDHEFCIGVAGYPEGHPECLTNDSERDISRDLENFRSKIDQGATFAISQLFLENDPYFEFLFRAKKAGIDIPILPGIMAMTDLETIGIITGLCGASVPEHLRRKYESAKEDPSEMLEIGIDNAIQQCKGLMDKVPCIHFYTMDKWEPTQRIIESLLS